MYDFSETKNKIHETKEWLSGAFSSIRTGRATPSILEGIQVESYGAKMPIHHLAHVTVEDAKTLRIAPWDKNSAKNIEQALSNADMGLSVNTDESGLRVIFPELTSERRESLSKLARDKAEEARVSVKKAREETWNDIQKQEKAGLLSEDDKFRLKDELQKIIDEANKYIDEMLARKEKEITT